MKIFEEGKAKIYVFENVFYNPLAKLSRDIGVAFLAEIGKLMKRKLKVCEPLAATGIRAIRYFLETNTIERITINDVLPIAYDNIMKNLELNKIEKDAQVFCKDANLLLNENAKKGSRFDFIDIDPYGSPMPFIQSATRALAHKGYLAITATDTAALCGVAIKACIRKYMAIPLRNEFMNEVGLRILIGAAIKNAAINEVALEPVLAHSTMHYMRVYLRYYVSSRKTDEILDKIGYLLYCFNCLWRDSYASIKPNFDRNCPLCGNKIEIAGPLWLGSFIDKEIARGMINFGIKEVSDLCSVLIEEDNLPPFYYNLDAISSKLKVSSPKVSTVIERLKNLGFKVSRTHFSPKGIRTNATIKEIREIMK
jgi:tRNA (guanine26-N2/guanine27-N2)-dimethyltransferase